MAAPVMGDAAEASGGKEEHLVFERVGGERPAMAENNRLTAAPILVIDLSPILRLDRWHGSHPYLRWDLE
jgi:hypothetical protein